VLPFLATEGSLVLEKKVNETQVSKTVFSHFNTKLTCDLSKSIITTQFELFLFFINCFCFVLVFFGSFLLLVVLH